MRRVALAAFICLVSAPWLGADTHERLTGEGPVKAIHVTPGAGRRALAVMAAPLAGEPVVDVSGDTELEEEEGITFTFAVTAGDEDLDPFTLEVEYSEGLSLGVDPQGWTCTFGAPGHASCAWTGRLPAGQTTGTAALTGYAQPPYGGAAECDPGRSPCAFLRATLPGVATDVWTTAVIVGGNHPPVAVVDDTAAVPSPPAPVAIDVLGNDTDADGDALTVTIAVPPSHGTVAVDAATQHVVYTPGPDFSGSDSFRYRATDPAGASATSLVAVAQLSGSVAFQSPVTDVGNIEPGKVAFRLNYLQNTTGLDVWSTVLIEPVDAAEFPALLAGTPYDPAEAVSDVSVFSASGSRLFNGADSSSPFGVSSRLSPPLGRVWLARVRLTLRPTTLPNVVLEASYVVVARGAGASEVPVQIVDDVVDTPAGTPVLIHPLDNDLSAAGQPLSVTGLAAAEPFHFDPPFIVGSVQFAEGQGGGPPFLGALYTPPPGFRGTTAFYYAASETPGGLINGRYDYARITVNVINRGPLAQSRAASIPHDTSLSYFPSELGSDADGDPLTLRIVSPPVHGTASLAPTGAVVYEPAAEFVGFDSFQFVLNDGTVDSNLGTVTITVHNVAPVAQSRADSVRHDRFAIFPPSDLGSDADGDSLTIRIVSPPAHGTMTTTGNGSVVYWPSPHFAGSDSFQFVLNDGILDSNVATVTITVGNTAPVAQSRADSIRHDTNAIFPLSDLGSDADFDPFTIRIVSAPAHGTTAMTGNGSVVYRPFEHFAGTDSFQFVVNDGVVDSNVATVTITVANAAPVAQSRADSIRHDTNAIFPLSDLGSDADFDPFTIRIVSAPAHGTTAMTGNGSVVYRPFPHFAGTDSFQFVVNDGVVDSNVGTVTITVTNAAPVLAPMASLTVPELAMAAFTATATDADGDALAFSLIGAPAGAQVDSGTGRFTWLPSEAQGPGSYTFGVRVTDALSSFDEKTVTITVTEANAAPALALPSLPTHIFAGSPFGFTATATDPDVPANTLTFSLAGAPAGAGIGPANGVFAWTPVAAQAGSTFTFAVVVTDDGSPAASAQRSVTVTVDAPPQAILSVSVAPDRSTPRALSGSVLGRLAYVFVSPGAAVTRVRFWLDDPSRTGPPRQVENAPPFDFAGTAPDGSAQAFDTRSVANGLHIISAEVTLAGGGILTLQGTFAVTNTTPVLLVSTSPNRSSPRALAGATLRANAYVFVQPDADAVRVRFWLDTSTAQPPRRTETSVPFDFAGTAANGNAAPFDTRTVPRGPHVIRAIVEYAGASVAMSATFVVDR